MEKIAKPIYAWALKTKGELNFMDITETRDDALAYQNKPAGQRVVRVKINEVRPKRKLKTK